MKKTDAGWDLSLDVKNTGDCAGDEVVQVYLRAERTKVVRPVKELIAYRRVSVEKGGTVRAVLTIPESVLSYYDADMVFGPHGGAFSFLVGTSSEQIAFEMRLEG